MHFSISVINKLPSGHRCYLSLAIRGAPKISDNDDSNEERSVNIKNILSMENITTFEIETQNISKIKSVGVKVEYMGETHGYEFYDPLKSEELAMIYGNKSGLLFREGNTSLIPLHSNISRDLALIIKLMDGMPIVRLKNGGKPDFPIGTIADKIDKRLYSLEAHSDDDDINLFDQEYFELRDIADEKRPLLRAHDNNIQIPEIIEVKSYYKKYASCVLF